MAIVSGTQVPRPELVAREIPVFLDQINSKLERLTSTVTELEARLKCILGTPERGEKSPSPNDKNPVSIKTDLGGSLNSVDCRIAENIRILDFILENLEL